jgi:hypothetical protein
MRPGYHPTGFWVDEWLDMHGDRPTRLVTRVTVINDEPVETVVHEPIAGVGDDGRYHVGRLVNPRVTVRAMVLTDAAELRRMGVETLDDREDRR